MYSLLYGLWSMLFAKVQYQVLILGLDDAGKTFLEQVKHLYAGTSPPEELKIPPTVGLNIGKLDVSRTRFLFWDLGGAASLRVLWDKYYSESHAILYILDSSSDGPRIEEAVREVRKLARDKDLREAPIIILANKMDRKDAQGTEGIVAALGLPPSASIVTAAETKGGLRPSTVGAATNGVSPGLAAASSSSSSSSPSVSSPSLASPASAAAAASAASVVDAFDGHLVKVLPVSALTGQGVAKVIEMLQQILPSCPRTQRMAAEKI